MPPSSPASTSRRAVFLSQSSSPSSPPLSAVSFCSSSSSYSHGISGARLCRCCYCPCPLSQLRPYRYLPASAFPSEWHHQHALCAGCDSFLHSGEWKVGADAHDECCRLCGEGDSGLTAFVCEHPGCSFCFCTGCIRANGGALMLTQCEQEQQWSCFVHDRRDGSRRLQLLDDVDLSCRAERGGFFHKAVFDCFTLCQQPIASFTYLTPKAKQRFCPAAPLSSSSFRAQRLLSTCLYKNTSLPPSSHCQYVYGLLRNLQLFPQLWPGWTLRIYYDNSLILPALPPTEEKDHDGSVSASSSAAVDCSQYTADVALAWSLLVSSLCRCRHVQFVYYNWPYLQDSSLHHHGHAGMMSRFLALAELGVTASHVAIVDLDNIWKAEGRRQAERDWQGGRLYHRYRDADYNFELMGGGFNARAETLNPRDPDASPFADIEAAIHSFLTRHHRRPQEVSDSYGQMIDEAQDSSHYVRRMKERKRNAEPAADTDARASTRRRRSEAGKGAGMDLTAGPASGAEAEAGDRGQHQPAAADDEKQAVWPSASGCTCRLPLCGCDSVKACAAEQRQQEQPVSSTTRPLPPSRHYFGYALDQIFLLETVWPVVRQSLETTAVRLPLISDELRQLKRGQGRAGQRGRDQPAAPPLFSHFFGQVDRRLFPKPAEVLQWVQQQMRQLLAAWRQQGARMGRTDMQWLYAFASPGHFTEIGGGGEEGQRVRQRWEAFIGPPSTTSPRDFAERWREEEASQAAAPPVKPAAAASRPLVRALSFSQADTSPLIAPVQAVCAGVGDGE